MRGITFYWALVKCLSSFFSLERTFHSDIFGKGFWVTVSTSNHSYHARNLRFNEPIGYGVNCSDTTKTACRNKKNPRIKKRTYARISDYFIGIIVSSNGCEPKWVAQNSFTLF